MVLEHAAFRPIEREHLCADLEVQLATVVFLALYQIFAIVAVFELAETRLLRPGESKMPSSARVVLEHCVTHTVVA